MSLTTNVLARPLPHWRWYVLLLGTMLLLSVYYLDYGADFHEGSVESSSIIAIPMRLMAVLLIVLALHPFQFRYSASWALLAFYAVCALSMLASFGLWGNLNDKLFVNTLIQLPVLLALSHTRWQVDHARWLRFVGSWLVLEACVDLAVLLRGQSLWISQAFVGGFGNPSSFGISCAVLFTFNLLHPDAGKYRLPKALMLAVAAIMTKALFAVLGVVVVYAIWTSQRRRRVYFALLMIVAAAFGVRAWLLAHDEEIFILHKLSAAAAFVGLMDYDTGSSASVSVRSEMHARTFGAVGAEPNAMLIGHLEGKAYWPMDSQVLTYLGSFGAVMLCAFLALHLLWMASALRNRSRDGKFSVIALGLFGLIFFTNRILDYFPVATLYFLCITMAISRRDPLGERPGRLPRATIGLQKDLQNG